MKKILLFDLSTAKLKISGVINEYFASLPCGRK
jgi:hypothetical protein